MQFLAYLYNHVLGYPLFAWVAIKHFTERTMSYVRSIFMSVFMFMALLTGCATVDPGTVVVEVPVCSEAADYQIKTQGRYWPYFTPCTEHYALSTREHRAVWTASEGEGSLALDESITFAGSDGQKVNMDVAVGYSIAHDPELIVTFIKTFGDNTTYIVNTRVRDSTRDSLSMCAATMGVDRIYGEGKTDLFSCALARLQAEYAPKGLIISALTLNSEIRLPEQIQQAMEASTAATQNAERTEREVASAEAEGRKRMAAADADAVSTRTRAKAEADANALMSASITPELLRLKALEIELEKAKRWDGKLPSIQGQSDMIIDLRTPAL